MNPNIGYCFTHVLQSSLRNSQLLPREVVYPCRTEQPQEQPAAPKRRSLPMSYRVALGAASCSQEKKFSHVVQSSFRSSQLLPRDVVYPCRTEWHQEQPAAPKRSRLPMSYRVALGAASCSQEKWFTHVVQSGLRSSQLLPREVVYPCIV